jgi:heme/copper-type cytochrome/quinol oxidase subunit 2
LSSRNTNVIAGVVVAAVILSGLLGFYFASITSSGSHGATTNTSQSQTTQNTQQNKTVYLDVIPDYGGATYDAFVIPSTFNGTAPTPGTNTTNPGTNDNNITISAGSTVKFVITSIDTAILENFSAKVSAPFAVYNDTASGVIGQQYTQNQSITNMPITHTFTVTELGLNIPIPPDTVVVFNYTFTHPGVFEYVCETPCGPGMGIVGYMAGYLIVQ